MFLLGIVGVMIDKFSIRVILPLALLIRAILFFIVFLIKDPNSVLFYIFTPLIHFGYFAVFIIVQAYLYRLYPKQIRALLNSISGIISTLGLLLINEICGWAYKFGPSKPLLVVTILDISLTMIVILLFSFTRFGSQS
jgi:hypothetical protein